MPRTPIFEDIAEAREIPILNFDAYLTSDDSECARLTVELRNACTGIDFFYVRNHGVASELIYRTFAGVKRFHAYRIKDKPA